jgi:hypothetical protein
VHSVPHPDFYRIYRVEQAVDAIREAEGTNPVQSFGPLPFDGV